MPGELPPAAASWPERRRHALADPAMRAAVAKSTRSLAAKKEAAFAAYPAAEAMRTRAVIGRRGVNTRTSAAIIHSASPMRMRRHRRVMTWTRSSTS